MNPQNETDAAAQTQDPSTRFAVAFLTLFLATFFIGKTATPQLGIGQIFLLLGLVAPDLRKVVFYLFVIYFFLMQ